MRLIDVDDLGVGRCSKDVLPAAYCAGWNGLLGLIEKAPTVDAVPVVHGRWIARFDGPYNRRRCYCSHCGKHNGVGGIAKNQEKPFCPNCGAKMDGERKDGENG